MGAEDAAPKLRDDLTRPMYLYALPPEVLHSLKPREESADAVAEELAELPESPLSRTSTSSTSEGAVGSQSCSLCGLSFATVLDQRSHLRSDWHAYNLKQKLRGGKAVSEAEFEKLVEDLDESLSGSDSDGSEDEGDKPKGKETVLSALLRKQANLTDAQSPDGDASNGKKQRGTGKPPLLWFSSDLLPEHTYFGIYRTLFTDTEVQSPDSTLEAINRRQLAPISMPKAGKDGAPPQAAYKGPHIFLCMIGGGHFAAMVVSLAPRQSKHAATSGPLNREATVLAHKTFHRYTTRRKQGGSQGLHDSGGKGAAHSAGAALRRYNEEALRQDVRELLRDWKGLLDTSDLLFIRATGTTNRQTLFGPYEAQVLQANDSRLRGFPFTTRRATQNELMRSFIELTRLKVQEILPKPAVDEKASEAAFKDVVAKKPAKPQLSEEEETALLHTSQIQQLIRRSKLPSLLAYLKSNDIPAATFRFSPQTTQQNHHAPTPLHLAATSASPALVTGLLVKAGADPTATNEDGKTAFALAADRATRDAFRVARSELGEEAWKWDDAGVPAPLTRKEAEEREAREKKEEERKENERRKTEEDRLRREGPKVADGKGKPSGASGLGPVAIRTAEERRAEEAKGMTPEMRMRLERERRARAAEARFAKAGGS